MVKEVAANGSGDKACGKCGSKDVWFKYMNNVKKSKIEQPRYKCFTCKVYFTVGDHNRPKPGRYEKKKGIDPEELRGLDRACSECKAENNAVFKFYNNKKTVGKEQPRFECLNCGKKFSMHFDGERLLPSRSVKRGKRAPPSPQDPALLSCSIVDDPYISSTTSVSWEYDVENEEQTDQFSNTEDGVLYDASVPMEQCYDGGQGSYTEEMDAAATMSPYYMIPNDNAASASEYYATLNAGQEEQFYTTDDRVYYQALSHMGQSNVDKYSSAYEYDVNDVEQGTNSLVDQSDDGQWSYTEEVMAAPAGIPFQVPNDDAASACEYKMVNAHQQMDQVSNADAFPVEQCAVSQYSSEEIKAAVDVLFPVPDYNEMVHWEDIEEDPALPVGDDASNYLWDCL